MTKTKTEKLKTLLAIILCAALVASLVPLIALGRYDWASADDFTNAARSANILREGGGFISLVSGAVKYAIDVYSGWQGTYFASFLLPFNPVAFGEQYYRFVPVLLLGLFLLGTFVLCRTIGRRVLNAQTNEILIAFALISLVSIQLLPTPVESFFWYCGSMIYTGLYSVSLIYYACLIALTREEKKGKRIFLLCAGVLLAFICGGASFHTALMSAIFPFLYALWFALVKKDRKRALALGVFFALSAAFLALNVLAPGNAARMSAAGTQSVNLLALALSCLKHSLARLNGFLHPYLVIPMLLLIPVFWSIYKRGDFHFRLPGLVCAFAFCVVSVGFAPTYFAYNLEWEGPGRHVNLVFFTYVWLIAFCEFYALGWVYNKYCEFQKLAGSGEKAFALVGVFAKKSLGVCAALLLLIWTGLFYSANGVGWVTSASALKSLLDGSAAAYSAQMEEFIAQCNDPSVEIPTTTPFFNRPALLWFDGPSSDEDNWCNSAIAGFYGKSAIKVTDVGEAAQ